MTNKKHYRLYVINKLPQLRVLDFQKVKLKVCEQEGCQPNENVFLRVSEVKLEFSVVKLVQPGEFLKVQKHCGAFPFPGCPCLPLGSKLGVFTMFFTSIISP